MGEKDSYEVIKQLHDGKDVWLTIPAYGRIKLTPFHDDVQMEQLLVCAVRRGKPPVVGYITQRGRRRLKIYGHQLTNHKLIPPFWTSWARVIAVATEGYERV